MKNFFRFLASLKLTVVLVLVIAVVLSAGTILESLRGSEAARSVYYAPWFFLLQGLFAINIVFAVWDRWPKNRYRIGFVITHLSMLIILVGALATWVYKVEGQLPLFEGQSSDTIFERGPGAAMNELKLPLTVRLDSFEIDTYPGTQRPAMFRSRVTVLEPGGGAARGGDRDEQTAPRGRLQLLPVQLPEPGRAGDVDPLGVARSRPADRLPRLRAPGGGHARRADHPRRPVPRARRA